MPTAPGYADISVEMRHGLMSRSAYITFGVNPVITDGIQIASKIQTALNAAGSLIARTDSQVAFRLIRVAQGTDGTEDLVTELVMTLVGGSSKLSLPPNCATLVHKLTGRGGRRGRGRFFWPWCVDNSVVSEAGVIDSSHVSTLQGAVTAFGTELGAQDVPMVVLHSPGETSMGAPDLVTSMRVDPLISTQRRRLGR